MSKIEITTPVNWQTIRRMKRDQLEQTLMLFVESSAKNESEVERLKLIVDQATKHMELDGTDVVIHKPFVGFAMIGYKFEIPELHDYLQENK